MNAEQLAFLIELLRTPGLSVPIDKCRIAADTRDALVSEWQRAVEALGATAQLAGQ